MRGRVLDTPEIKRLVRHGWTNAQIAKHFGVPTMSVAVSQHKNNWEDDPTLRKRWEARMPALKAQLKKLIKETAP